MSLIGVALVGYGSAGRQHAHAVESSGVAEVRSVCEIDGALDVGPYRRVRSLDEAVADPGTDVVALCLPPGPRRDLAGRVVRSGRALLVEKPPAMSGAEVLSLAREADDHRVPAAVMLQHRTRLPDLVRELPWGPEATATLEVSRPRTETHYRRAPWRTDPQQALGGISAHLGVHYLDLACVLLGEPVRLTALGRRELMAGIDSRVSGTVLFDSGATLAFTVTAESDVRSERLAVYGAGHRLVVEDGRVTVTGDERCAEFPPEPTPALRARVYQDLAEALSAGRPPRLTSLRSAHPVMRLLELAHQAPDDATAYEVSPESAC